MDFRDVLTRRRSIRAYADRPVPREVLERVTNAAVVWAPSGGFSQGLRLVVVTDPARSSGGSAGDGYSTENLG